MMIGSGGGKAHGLVRAYLGFLVLLWLGQTWARLHLFVQADFGTGLPQILYHLTILLALLTLLFLILSMLGRLVRPEGWRAGVGVVAIASVHTLLSVFDLYQFIFIGVSGDPGPTWMIFFGSTLALSLLDNVGIQPWQVVALLVAIFAAHLLLYFPVRHILPARAAALRRGRMRFGRLAIGGQLAAACMAVAAGTLLAWAPSTVRVGEPITGTFLPIFQIAPAELLASAETAPPLRSSRPEPTTRAGGRPLVLIVVDALARDRMGLYNPVLRNTPFLNSLEARGSLQKFDAHATCTFSFCGIMSVVASRSWNDFGARPTTIIDRLTDRSYETHLMLAGQHAGFGGLTNLLGRSITSIAEQPPRTQPDDQSVLAQLEKVKIGRPDRSFLYLHLVSTHAGTFIQPRFRTTPGDTGRMGAYLFDPAGKAAYRRIYDLRVRQADDVIRRAFAILERRGLLRDALVVITADHGQRTSEGGLLYHGGEADAPTINIPLLIYDARGGHLPARVPASQIDVAPTIAEAAGLAPAPGWTGVALQRRIDREAVPVGTSSSTGIVYANGDTALLYLCNRKSGKERVDIVGGTTAGSPPLAKLRRLHRTVSAPIPDPACRR